MEFINKNALLLRFAEKNVRIETEITCKEVTDDGIIVVDKSGREKKIKADNVVLAAGTKSVNSLEKELTGIVPEIYMIGDAKEPRKIWHAVSEGFMLGRRV
jgi:NADH dehydrogenase FAD-containing subunit